LASDLSGLPATEAVDPATQTIDTLEPPMLALVLVQAHERAVTAAINAAPALGEAIELVAVALRAGRSVYAIGAGTSGRLAVLDAAELPPTFGVAPETVTAVIAGGSAALTRAIEGAEDDPFAGADALARAGPGDVAIGISASGGAPFVVAALRAARAAGAATIAIVNAPGAPLLAHATLAIVLETAAEPIAGSTRLVAGTAQKIALNTISTGAMIRLGKTYRNRMVDLVVTNAKLRARAERLVAELGDVPCDRVAALLDAADGEVKTAIVMARRGVDPHVARDALAAASGRLALVLDPPGGASGAETRTT
jgi:N-acetylmuramic acid 6-phosphate etherase